VTIALLAFPLFIDSIRGAVSPATVNLSVTPEINFPPLLALIRALLAVLGDRRKRRAEVRVPPLTKVAALLMAPEIGIASLLTCVGAQLPV